MERELVRPDAATRQDVKDALHGDVRVDDRMIRVDVRDGVVHLHGAVPGLAEKAVARDIAARIKGVRQVHNELAVQPPVQRSDVDVTADVAAALTRDSLVDEDKIEVTTVDRVVYLRGTVDSYVSRRAAEEDARGVPGVLDVIDDLTVAPSLARSDEDIAHAVWQDLQRNLRLQEDAIDVQVAHGVALLRGRVETHTQRWLADEIARWTPGVVDVINEIASA